MLIWLCAVDHRRRLSYRQRGGGGEARAIRHRLYLPHSERLDQLLVSQGLARPCRTSTDVTIKFSVVGLAHISAAIKWHGPLTVWSWQAKLQWEYFLRPADGVALRVESCAFLQEPYEVLSRRCEVSDQIRYMRTGGDHQHWVFLPVLPDDFIYGEVVFQSGQTVREFAMEANCWSDEEDLSCVPCLCVASEIVQLLQRGLWAWLMVLERWFAQLPFPFQFAQPRQHCGSDQQGLHLDAAPDLHRSALTAQRFEDLAARLRSWAPIILASPNGDDELHALSTAVDFLDSAAASFTASSRFVPGRTLYTSSLLIDVVRLCRHTRGAPLESVLRRAVSIAFPCVLDEAMDDLFAAGLRVPSLTTQHRCRLSLDVALMLLQRQVVDAGGTQIRFGWADSSPQLSRDWMLCSHDWLFEADLVSAATTVDALIESRFERERSAESAVAGGGDADDDQTMINEQTQNDRQVADAARHKWLLEAIHRHDHPPVTLGKGSIKLADKASALLYSFALECSTPNSLGSFMNSFFTFTTDLGTEVGVSTFESVDIASLMPCWMTRTQPRILMDVDMDDHADPAPPPPPEPPAGPSKFLPSCLAVGGLLHLIYNLTKELSTALPWWDEFWKRLKQLELLLGDRPRREAFIKYVLAHTRFADCESDFNVSCPNLYDKRWNEVIEFCAKTRWRIQVLRSAWDHDKYIRGAGEDARAASFQPTPRSPGGFPSRTPSGLRLPGPSHGPAQPHPSSPGRALPGLACPGPPRPGRLALW